MPKEINPLQHLRALVKQHGNQKNAAAALGLSQAFISDILNGHRQISAKMLAKMGLRNVVVPVTKERDHDAA